MKCILRAGCLILIGAAGSWAQGTDTIAVSRPDTVVETKQPKAPPPKTQQSKTQAPQIQETDTSAVAQPDTVLKAQQREAPPPEAPQPQTQAPQALELVLPEKYGLVKEWLLKNGIDLTGGTLFSMAFKPDQKTLVIIMLDAQGQPIKKVVKTNLSLYKQVIARPVAKKAAEPAPPTAKDRSQEGRLYFITHTSLKSLYVYPFSYATLFDYDDFNIVAGLSLLTFGGAVYGSYKFSADRELGYGRVALMNYGGELALTYAQLMKWLIHSREDRRRYYDPYYDDYYYDSGPDNSGTVKAFINMVGFPLGIYLGARAKLTDNYDYGKIAIMRFFGRSAILYGMVIPWLFYDDADVLFDVIFSFDNYYSDPESKSYGTVASLFTMGLIPVGNYIGYTLAQGKTYSSGRSVMIETAGLMGAATGFILPSVFESETKNVYLISGLVGAAAGTAIGFNYHQGQEYRFSQGAFMALSAVGGAAVALGLPLLVEADHHQAYTIAAMAGGWLGLILGENLSQKIFEKSDKDRQAINIDLPLLYQWPLVVSSYKSDRPVKAEIISVTF
jgi:hypothetical protein